MDVLEHTRRGGVARFLERIQPENGDEARLDEFKEALWSTVVKFGEVALEFSGSSAGGVNLA